MAPVDLPHSAGAIELTSGPSESIMAGGMAINPILAELKTIMEAL